jgi:hypothetical protein
MGRAEFEFLLLETLEAYSFGKLIPRSIVLLAMVTLRF